MKVERKPKKKPWGLLDIGFPQSKNKKVHSYDTRYTNNFHHFVGQTLVNFLSVSKDQLTCIITF